MNLIGIDIIDIHRISLTIERWGGRFLHRIYTPRELSYCRGRIPQLASRFAAKEAVMKLLGTGRPGINWRDIEVIREQGGRPTINLQGRALKIASVLNINHISISISHDRDMAIASVIADTINPS